MMHSDIIKFMVLLFDILKLPSVNNIMRKTLIIFVVYLPNHPILIRIILAPISLYQYLSCPLLFPQPAIFLIGSRILLISLSEMKLAFALNYHNYRSHSFFFCVRKFPTQ
eukprot:529766_1